MAATRRRSQIKNEARIKEIHDLEEDQEYIATLNKLWAEMGIDEEVELFNRCEAILCEKE